MRSILTKDTNSIIFKTRFPGDTEADDADEDPESEAAFTEDELMDDEEVADTKLPGSISQKKPSALSNFSGLGRAYCNSCEGKTGCPWDESCGAYGFQTPGCCRAGSNWEVPEWFDCKHVETMLKIPMKSRCLVFGSTIFFLIKPEQLCCGPRCSSCRPQHWHVRVARAPVKSVEKPISKSALSIASSSPKNDAQIPPWPPWCHGTPRDFGEPGIPLPHTKVDTPAPGSPVASVHQWNLRSPVQDRKLWRRKRIMGKQRMLCFGSSSS